jgi:hypothetical protein
MMNHCVVALQKKNIFNCFVDIFFGYSLGHFVEHEVGVCCFLLGISWIDLFELVVSFEHLRDCLREFIERTYDM